MAFDWKKLALWLVIVGGINWGLALAGVNLVEMLLKTWPIAVKVVYGAVAAAAIYLGYEELA